MNKPAPTFYYPNPRTLHYCTQCGKSLERIIPPDDNRVRDACPHCGAVHYQNPRCVVGLVPILDERVLLCRRAIEPQYNKRSEEHTSELQSRGHIVCRLLLEKKKKIKYNMSD